jgi:hypothetical protein
VHEKVTPRTRERRLVSWVTAINVLIATGFSVVGLIHPESILPPKSVPTTGSSVFAMYAAARTLPLTLLVLVAIHERWEHALLVLGVLAGAIQLSDFVVGIVHHDPGKAVGPLVIATLQFYALFALHGSIRGGESA